MKDLISRPLLDRRSSAVERAFIAMTRGAVHPRLAEREQIERGVFADDRAVAAILHRATAPIGTTTTSGFAAELAQDLVGSFLATLAPLSAAATLIAQGLQVPLARAASMKLPAREGAPSTTVSWVGESDPIPVREYALNDDCELAPRKHGFIIGVSREVAKRAGGDAVIRTLIREDAAATLDGAYFATDAGDADSHAGMLAGLTPLAGYGGGDRVAMETDLTALSDVVSAGGSGQLAFIVSPKRANAFRIRFPEHAGLTMLPSLAVADDRVIAVDPASWAHGFGDDFEIDVSPSATIHMDTEPEQISDSGVAAPVRSYWQTDCLAYRLLADVAFAARRTNAVAYLDGATW